MAVQPLKRYKPKKTAGVRLQADPKGKRRVKVKVPFGRVLDNITTSVAKPKRKKKKKIVKKVTFKTPLVVKGKRKKK